MKLQKMTLELYRIQIFRLIINKLFKNKKIFQTLTFFDHNKFTNINNKIFMIMKD
jgi:hypothetical protein